MSEDDDTLPDALPGYISVDQEWLPGVLWPVHHYEHQPLPHKAMELRGKHVRVKPLEGELSQRGPGCEPGARAYTVHPDDVERIWPGRRAGAVCEHEVQLD